MNKVVLACLMAGAVSAITSSAATITFSDGPGSTGGGEFNVVTSDNGSFITFCLEYNETIAMNTTYNYVVSQAAKNGGSGGGVNGQDPLSKATAWLYLQFLGGTLLDINHGTGNLTPGNYYDHAENDANALQKAIWYLEGESQGVNNAYAQLAIAQAGSGDNNGFYNVGVMNITDRNGNRKQDQLVRINVPDGGTTLVFLGMAMTGLAAANRRYRKN